MRKNENTKNLNIKLTAFWSLVGVFTLAFIITVIVTAITLRPINSYSDIKRDNLALVGNDIFTQTGSEYYVYVYSSGSNTNIDNAKAEEVNQGIFNYFNFVKHNSKSDGILRIYGLDIDFITNKSIVSNSDNVNGVTKFENLRLTERKLPVLLRVYDGGIDHVSVTTTEILSELAKAMDKVK